MLVIQRAQLIGSDTGRHLGMSRLADGDILDLHIDDCAVRRALHIRAVHGQLHIAQRIIKGNIVEKALVVIIPIAVVPVRAQGADQRTAQIELVDFISRHRLIVVDFIGSRRIKGMQLRMSWVWFM